MMQFVTREKPLTRLVQFHVDTMKPVWIKERTGLILIFEERKDGKIIARGIDPDAHRVRLIATVRPDQLDAFYTAITNPRGVIVQQLLDSETASGELMTALDGESVESNTVVITDPGPGDGGPKVQYRLSLESKSTELRALSLA